MKGSVRILLLFVAVFAMAACQSPKKVSKSIQKMTFRSEPDVLEVNGDSILVNVKGKFPPHAFPKNALVKFQPILHYGDSLEMPLNVMYLKGEKVKGQEGKVIHYSKGGSFTYTDKIPYKDEMKHTKLDLDYNIKLISKYSDLNQCLAGTSDTSFYGTITTSLTVKPTDDVYTLDSLSKGNGTRKVIFYYVINEGRLRDSAKKGPATAEITRILKDTNFKVASIIMHGYASPDGELKHNEDLTVNRTNSATDLVKTLMKRSGMKKVYDSTFVKSPDNGEDWAGLKKLAQQTDFPGKADVMGVLNDNSISDDQKEAKLRQLPSWNTVLVSNLLPRLRRTEVIFSGNIPARSYDELSAMATKDSSSLNDMSMRELVLLGNKTTDTAMKLLFIAP
jgi:hypothetical protein